MTKKIVKPPEEKPEETDPVEQRIDNAEAEADRHDTDENDRVDDAEAEDDRHFGELSERIDGLETLISSIISMLETISIGEEGEEDSEEFDDDEYGDYVELDDIKTLMGA